MTPMHFQYLVGLCCLRCHPDAVEMTIGDRVRDSASESDRDVDVTIVVAEPGGERTAFIGYDAKMEDSALHVDTVEQLCAKLNDMPDLTMRAIVSAKGFSETGIRKAMKHGVKLFEFREWTDDIKASFPNVSLQGPPAEAMTFACTEFRWVTIGAFCINPNSSDRTSYVPELTLQSALFQEEGVPHPLYPTLQLFLNEVRQRASVQLSREREAQQVLLTPLPYPPHMRPDGPIGEPLDYPNLITHVAEPIFFLSNGAARRIESIGFSGSLQWQYTRHPVEYRVLVDISSQQAYAGAAIAAHPIHPDVMLAVTLAAESDLANIRPFRLTEKQKNFIHKLKVRA